jgi:hypothetical protein
MMHGRQSKQEGLFKELKRFAEQSGFEVRCEKLLREVGYRVRSGSCSVNGRRWIILDRNLPPAERLDLLADAICDSVPETLTIPSNLQKYLARKPEVSSRRSEVRSQKSESSISDLC